MCSDHVPEQGFRGTYAPKSLFGSHVVAGSRRTGEAVPVQAGQVRLRAGCAPYTAHIPHAPSSGPCRALEPVGYGQRPGMPPGSCRQRLTTHRPCPSNPWPQAPTGHPRRAAPISKPVVLDVRPATEYAAGHIPDADRSRWASLPPGLRSSPPRRRSSPTPWVYCVLSHDAVRFLTSRGRRAVRLDGGILEWQLTGEPLSTTAA